MCFGGKGGLGGLLGGLAGGALDFAFPEVGIPLALATGGGGFLGNLLGGGDLKGAATEGLALGAAGGLGSLAAGGEFLGAAPGTGISGAFGGGSAAAGDVAGTAGGAAGAGAALPGAASSLITGSDPALAATAAPTSLTATGAATPAVTGSAVGSAAGVPSTTDAAATATDFGGGGDLSGGTLGSKILNYIKSNPLAVLSAGAAAYPLLQGNTVPGLSDLQNSAKLQATQGNQMAQALSTGQLPQGAQATLDNAAQAARARVRSEYGSMGLTGSTLEADKLASIDSETASQKFGMLKDVTNSGLTAIGNSDKLLETIMQTEISQDKATADSIARLVAALAGGGAGATKAAA